MLELVDEDADADEDDHHQADDIDFLEEDDQPLEDLPDVPEGPELNPDAINLDEDRGDGDHFEEPAKKRPLKKIKYGKMEYVDTKHKKIIGIDAGLNNVLSYFALYSTNVKVKDIDYQNGRTGSFKSKQYFDKVDNAFQQEWTEL